MAGTDSEIRQTLVSFLLELKNSQQISNLHLIDSNYQDAIDRGGKVAVEGKVQVDGHELTLHVWIDALFPHSLPLVYLVPPSALGFIPHVNQHGFVCYAQSEGLFLNPRDPPGILENAIERSVGVLESGLRGDNKWDFVDEFEAYWDDLPDVSSVLSLITPDETLRQIVAVVKEEGAKKEYVILSDDATSIHAFSNNKETKQYTHRNALYVPFKKGVFIVPPQPGALWGLEDIQRLVDTNISSENAKKLQKLSKKWKRDELVIFRLPKPSDGEVLFGILFTGVDHSHPLQKGGTADHLKPLITRRNDKMFLLPRGGANHVLQSKRVAVIGCGAVGGFLIEDLVRSGVLNLMLIDYDLLTEENTFRHALGKNHWGKLKAVALQEELRQKYPYVKAQVILEKAETALTSGVLEPSKWDLIIVAIGDDTACLHLNELLTGKGGVPPVLYTWLEAYGIGGHALLTGTSSKKGCYECLFTALPGSNPTHPHNRAAFAAPSQSFSKNISGCANRFTPYGSLDAETTAQLASRLAIQTLLGQVQGNLLRSWKGNASEFLGAGYKLSQRYGLSEDELNSHQNDFAAPNCPVCGNIE